MRIIYLAVILLCSRGLFSSEFLELMGKDTDHWIYVKDEADLKFLEKFEELYEKNKNLQFTDKGDYKIPKVIHFIWLGPNSFPPESVENVRTWIGLHPDWKFKFWTDRKRAAPCSSMEICDANNFPFLFLGHCYQESQNWGEKSDILRFEILYQEGGVYLDHDANCLKSFAGIHRGYDFYCGLETPHPPVAGRNLTSGNGVIGARPFHPVIGRVIELIDKDWGTLGIKYRGRDGYSRTQLVMERTYIMLTHALMDRLSEDNNMDIVFPAAYFFAKKDIPALYSQHFFANTWADEGIHDDEFEKSTKQALGKLHRRNHTIRWVGRGALSLNLLAFTGMFLYIVKQKRRRRR